MSLDDLIGLHMGTSGGSTQRAMGISASASKPSLLKERLLEMWAWGRISATTVQALAEAAQLDGLQHPDIVGLANLGTRGDHGQNVRRDLLQKTFPDIVSPKPMQLEIEVLSKTNVRVPHNQSMLSPLAVLQKVYDLSPELVPAVFGRDIEAFWQNIRDDDPRMLAHHALRNRDAGWQRKAIPVVLHGDGATFTTRGEHSIVTIDWRGLLAQRFQGWVFPCWSIIKGCATAEALSALWKRTVFLFNQAYHGVHPDVNENGDEWAEGSYEHAMRGRALCNGEYFWYS